MFAGLQELGVANGEDLKETLTNCMEPLKAIEQFQVEGKGAGKRGGGFSSAFPLPCGLVPGTKRATALLSLLLFPYALQNLEEFNA